MPLDTFQLGEPVEHRGIVVAPLFPRHDPVAAYVTLDEALPRGFRIDRDVRRGHRAGARRREPARRARPPLRRRGARRREAEPHPQRERPRRGGAKLPIPVSCVEQGRWHARSAAFRSADHISHSHLRRRKAEMLAAQPLARGVAQGEVWDELQREADAHARRLRHGASRDIFEAHRAALRAARGRVPARARTVRRRARARRRPLRRRRVAARRVCAPLAEAPRRLPARRARAARRPRDVGRAHPSFVDEVVGGARDARAVGGARRGRAAPRHRVIGSGLELDGELIQLSAFTSNDAAGRAFGRIARPSVRR